MSLMEPKPKRTKTDGANQKPLRRPTKPWNDLCDSSQRNYVAALTNELKEWPNECVVSAVIKMLKESDNSQCNSLSLIIKDSTSSFKSVNDVLDKIRNPVTPTRPLSSFQGLCMLLDANLSKRQFLKVRESAVLCGTSVFPSYDNVRKAKQECRPPLKDASISETSASFSLASLADFTTKRIVNMQKDVICQNQATKKVKSEICTIIFSCGFDGSSGHSNYKQKYADSQAGPNDDSSIFATTIVPLRLHNQLGDIYWNNATPQSIRFCRPLKIQFGKETRQLITDEKKSLDDQINALKDSTFVFDNGHEVVCKFKFYFSMIDGKVLSVITNTKSSQSCPICGCKPNEFNVKGNMDSGKFKAKQGSLLYGISPLHAYIRSLEWLLHVSYKLDSKKWQARSAKEKESAKSRKTLIQERLWKEMGLRVDFPNAGGSGTSNDGNTARRAFQQFEKFAEILGLKVEIVKMTRNVLIALNCQLPINAQRFRSYCYHLYVKYLDEYSWYKLPASIHKVLAHGSDIVSATSLPLGMIGEEAAEARNKVYKADREFHARKSSRYNTMYDMFFRAIDSSDPIMSTYSLESRLNSKSKRETLPFEVVQLLEIPDPKFVGGSKSTNNLEVEYFDVAVANILDEIVLDNENEMDE